MMTADAIRSRENAAMERADRCSTVNVGEAERLASKVGGGVLVGLGLMRGGVRGLMLAGLGGALLYRGVSGHCSLYEAIGADTADDERGPEDSVPARAGVRVEESITIGRSPEDLYRFWRDYANLPRFMGDIESVTATNPAGTHSHWVARAPMGVTLEWDAEIYNETPGEMIAWRSTGGQVETAGSVHFTPAPGDQGTEVRVNQKFNPPGGKLGVAVAKLLGHDPNSLCRENLRRLKRLMEIGEVPTVTGQTSGRA